MSHDCKSCDPIIIQSKGPEINRFGTGERFHIIEM